MQVDNKNLQGTIDEGKRLWGLVQQYAKLELVDKLTFILTIMIVGGVLMAIGAIAIYCFCMFVVEKLAAHTGDTALSYCIVGVVLLLIALVLVRMRGSLVTKPLIKALMKEFFEADEEEKK